MSSWTVLGGGVVGLCVATALMERGEEVEVIDDLTSRPASWFAGGMLAPFCESESSPSNIISLGEYSAKWWQKRVSSVEQRGTLVIAPARDTQELKRFARMTKKYQWVTPNELEPALEQRFTQGLFFSCEAHLNPRIALMEMREKLLQNGVVFHLHKPRGRIIDCCGIYAASQLSGLRGVRGEMLILKSNDVHFSRPIRLLHPRFPCYLVPRYDGYFMLGATMIESIDDSVISVRGMMELLSSAYVIHPALVEARIVESGSGLRPAYASNMPKISYKDGIFYLNGMYRHGFLLAPIMSEQLMQYLSGEKIYENSS
ncbi:FAD-dependent oxidoreductase [Candidatus Pantoea carbekii]|uniref:FAD-dependent oxidoreductase n=1 Tax=Candidatus Pantoea carbekii TaxID=1235990 RepID=UPI00061874CA|nr:FAD-dependent oxidoreductase [Candidatus Pantoea carbekii]AKC32622.1 glycine oxidase ThiO [Candidatus Pantoea carbekii]